jgi:hypothetical protein
MQKYPSKKNFPNLSDSERKQAIREYNKEWRKTPKAKESIKASRERRKPINFKAALKRHYDLTPEDYLSMLESQKGRCAICSTHQKDLKRSLQVDHDHKTGKVRGLLCNSCNGGLGLFKDETHLLYMAAGYLNLQNKN